MLPANCKPQQVEGGQSKSQALEPVIAHDAVPDIGMEFSEQQAFYSANIGAPVAAPQWLADFAVSGCGGDGGREGIGDSISSSDTTNSTCAAHTSPEALTHHARFHLIDLDADGSASQRLNTGQIRLLGRMGICALILLAQHPEIIFLILIAITNITFLSVAALRFASIPFGLVASKKNNAETRVASAAIPDEKLPFYTVMIPLFRESAVLPKLISSLKRIDYPADKLQIMLLFEEEDTEMIRDARLIDLPERFLRLIIPASQPQTKPKACNYAIQLARGDLLVVYDAEDNPPADQLRLAASFFCNSGDEVACLQAQLNFFNWHENWLTRQFAIEYGALYDLLLPALAKLGIPIPLGGTSTHFRTHALREVGAWDPFNVTEDADLGYRFAANGYKCGFFHSTTHEEANCEPMNWLRQRTRWLKGWMQTYLVRMRHPVTFYRTVGPLGFITFQIMMGGFITSALAHPIFYLMLLFESDGLLSLDPGSGTAFYFTATLLSGYVSTIAAGIAAVLVRRRFSLLLSCLATPFCWMLISVAAYRAAIQLITRPFHWEKTTHGLTNISHN